MKRNIILDDKHYTDAPRDVNEAFDRAVEIKGDFLPSPDELAKASVKKTVTIRLDSVNIEYFKRAANLNGTHYQTMINDLLSEYVRRHQEPRTPA